MHKYEVIIYWSNEDQVFVAEVTELPGCMAHGSTKSEALTNVDEAAQLWLDTAAEFWRSNSRTEGTALDVGVAG